jgi:hypothetical protein
MVARRLEVFSGYTLYGVVFVVQLILGVLVYYNKLSMTEQTFLLSPKFRPQYLSDHENRTVLRGAFTENSSSKRKLDRSEKQAPGPMFFNFRVTRTKVRARFVTNGEATTTTTKIISKHKKGF